MRTATCPYCGTGNMAWLTDKVGWPLKDRASGEIHTCEQAISAGALFAVNGQGGGPSSGTLGTILRTISEQRDAMNGLVHRVNEKHGELVDFVSAVRADLEREIQAIPRNGSAPSQDTEKAFAELASAAVTMASTRIRDQVAQHLRELAPVTHNIVITRPDGTTHEIRDRRPHKLFRLLLQVSQARKHAMLVGPAGSGKTTAGAMVAEALDVPYFEASLGPQTSQWDLMGHVSPTTGAYHPGILRNAYENGGVLMLDEVDNSNSSILVTLNSALGNGHCNFPDARVTVHRDFICIASGNTYGRGADRMYVGRQQLDAATLNRFKVLNWDYDEDAEATWAGPGSEDWVAYVQRIRKIVNDLRLREVVSPRQSIDGWEMLCGGMDRAEVEDVCIWNAMSDDSRAKIRANLESAS